MQQRGTTVRGGFDPLNEIADICASENMFMHVDAAWGGPLIFSETNKSLVEGIGLFLINVYAIFSNAVVYGSSHMQ